MPQLGGRLEPLFLQAAERGKMYSGGWPPIMPSGSPSRDDGRDDDNVFKSEDVRRMAKKALKGLHDDGYDFVFLMIYFVRNHPYEALFILLPMIMKAEAELTPEQRKELMTLWAIASSESGPEDSWFNSFFS